MAAEGENVSSSDTGELKLEQRIAALEEARNWSDKVAIHGVLAGVYQGESASGPDDADSIARGAISFQPSVLITPTERDEVFFEFAFPAGNGLNGETQMLIAPWAANLEADVIDIQGRDRSYLLLSWYKHTFELGESNSLGITGGIIDATAYLDQNSFANDQYTQFMNAALVNGPNGFAPSYDIGGAVEWAFGDLYVNGVVMNIGKNDSDVNYDFFGGELGYVLHTGLGEGIYRLIYEGGQNAFWNPEGTALEDRNLVFLSCDQQFGKHFGAWIRFGWGNDDAAVDATNLYSGGIDVGGGLWRRENDNVGLGIAYAYGGNTGVDNITVGELYYRWVVSEWLAVNADLQYQDNTYEDAEAGQDIDAWTWGLMAVVEF